MIIHENFISSTVLEHYIDILGDGDLYGVSCFDKQLRIVYATVLVNIWVVIAIKLHENWKDDPAEREREEWFVGERKACDLWATVRDWQI